MASLRNRWPRPQRVDLIFVLAVAMIVHQSFFTPGPADATIVGAAVAMFGLPLVVRNDQDRRQSMERRRENGDDREDHQ